MRRVHVASLGALLLSAGCANNPQASQPDRVAEQVAGMLEPNVVGVHAYYDPYNPWLWNENRTRPTGIAVQALYLEGPKVKGVFGDGIIRPRMYVAVRTDDGETDWKLVKDWQFNTEESIPYRSKRETTQGYGYRFHLPWGDLDLRGREIRMIIDFERPDGRVFSSGKKDFRVPRPATR